VTVAHIFAVPTGKEPKLVAVETALDEQTGRVYPASADHHD
jgi:hypothetical protein